MGNCIKRGIIPCICAAFHLYWAIAVIYPFPSVFFPQDAQMMAFCLFLGGVGESLNRENAM